MSFFSRLILVLTGILFFGLTITAQVTIGSSHKANAGSILDLKQDKVASGANSTKGLLLPRVQLKSASQILTLAEGQETAHTGLMVYNVGDQDCAFSGIPRGVYIWNGEKWVLLSEKDKNLADEANAAIYINSISNENLAGTVQKLDEFESYVLKGHADGQNINYKWSGPAIVASSPSADGSYTIGSVTDANIGLYTCTMTDACDEAIAKTIDIRMGNRACSPALDIDLKVYLGSNPTVALVPNQDGKYEIKDGEDIILKAIYDTGVGVYSYEWTEASGALTIHNPTDTQCVIASFPKFNEEYTFSFTAKDEKDANCNHLAYAKSVTLVKKFDCSAYSVTMEVAQSLTGAALTKVNGVYEVSPFLPIYYRTKINGAKASDVTMVWESLTSPFAKPTLVAGESHIYKSSKLPEDLTTNVSFKWTANNTYGCAVIDNIIELKVIYNTDCTIPANTFTLTSPTSGYLAQSANKRDFICMVPESNQGATITSKVPVYGDGWEELFNGDYVYKITSKITSVQQTKMTVNGCTGSIIISVEGQYGGCLPGHGVPDDEAMSGPAGYILSSKGIMENMVHDDKDLSVNVGKDATLQAGVMIGQTWERQLIPADSKEFVALWFVKADGQVSKLYNNFGVVGADQSNRTIKMNAKGRQYDYKTVYYEIGIQIIQLSTGCVTQGWHSVWPRPTKSRSALDAEERQEIELDQE